MPHIDPWLFWLLVYWFGLYTIFLDWYAKNKRERMTPLVAFFGLLFIGFLPVILIILALHKTKR